jgi:hypothetical protein
LKKFLFRLKRRLEQYEHDRQIERAHANRIQAKREADIEARLRKDRVWISLIFFLSKNEFYSIRIVISVLIEKYVI